MATDDAATVIMTNDALEFARFGEPAGGGWRWEAAALALLVLALYFTRLTTIPICGEESRWANGAREMIATGDWIVPRQQGDVFPERPPLGSWMMALVGMARGQVDLVAVRLPSACATLLLTCLIYAYVRAWTSRVAALAAGLIYATSAQVLVLGRFGESEAVFTLFVAGGLLAWHWAYLRGRRIALAWSLGYSLTALGALSKGPQAPVYFMAATSTYLAIRRDWHALFSRWHLAGLCLFAGIVGLWLVPFARDQWYAIDDIWTGLAQDRFTTVGLARHMVTYPFETLACMLPWSPMLLSLAAPSVRRRLAEDRPGVLFHLVALAVTYPTVWLAAAARGRYFMPLYPCMAVLAALAVEQCIVQNPTSYGRTIWRHIVRCLSIAIALGGAVVFMASVLNVPQLAEVKQTGLFLVLWTTATLATTAILFWSSLEGSGPRAQIALLTTAAFVGLVYVGPVLSARVRSANDLAPAVAEIKGQLPGSGELVSLGRVYHRFAYSYDAPIRQVPWPMAAADLPAGVRYFCFDRRPSDTLEVRGASDDRSGGTTPGTLPFEWDPVVEIPCDPVKRGVAHRTVVVGRVRDKPRIVAEPGINRPVRR